MKVLRKNLFPLQITQKMYVWIFAFFVVLTLIFAIIIPLQVLYHEEEEFKLQLYAVDVTLANRFPKSLLNGGIVPLSIEEIQPMLAPIVEAIGQAYPKTHSGYYCIELGQMIAHSKNTPPSFLATRNDSLTVDGKPLFAKSLTQGIVKIDGENYYFRSNPVLSSPASNLHTWAIAKVSDIDNQAWNLVGQIMLVGLTCFLILNLIMWKISYQLRKELESFATLITEDGIPTLDGKALFHRSLPELNPILDRVQQLQQAAKLTAVSQFAGSVVHEIKNPLTTMRGFSQLLQTRIRDEQSLSYIRFIIDEVDRLNQLATDFLRLTKAGDPHVESVCLNKLFIDIDVMVGGRFLKEKVRFNRPMEKFDYHVLADPNLLRQVLLNLLLNALQATESRRNGVVSLTVRANDPWVLLEVTDNGYGIPQHQLKRIFEPFFTTKEYGTGLGLSFSKETIEKQGGRIAVHSREGEGSTFAIFLSVADDKCQCNTPSVSQGIVS